MVSTPINAWGTETKAVDTYHDDGGDDGGDGVGDVDDYLDAGVFDREQIRRALNLNQTVYL